MAAIEVGKHQVHQVIPQVIPLHSPLSTLHSQSRPDKLSFIRSSRFYSRKALAMGMYLSVASALAGKYLPRLHTLALVVV